jgi:UDP-GlcNAc:undecaprenyl-phosphate/decaprenyl-phosphate GlcNAc-1-phosphate transferase
MHSENIIKVSVVVFLATVVLSGALVALTVRICRKRGWVARPRSDRWHTGTPSLFGGVPIWLTCLCLCFATVPFSDRIVWKLLGASSFVFLLGLADDILHLRPQTKLAGQLLAALLVVGSGIVYPLQQNAIINSVISVIWIVGITNAFNLLDNMDGLTAGVALISAVYLAIFYGGNGSWDYALLAVVVAGAAAGFLLFNFNPARIFMGDCGSLFLGFLLGSASLLEVTHVSGIPPLVLAPVVVLAIPVFDTLFVSVTRRLRGQAISQGGTDHSSHRLVQLGLNERSAVLLLCALSIASGAVALVARHILYSRAIGLIGFWFLFLLLFGIHLFRSEMIDSTHNPHTAKTLLRRLLTRDALAFLLDPVALTLAYYLAYVLRFRAYVPRSDMDLFLRTWPIVLALKFISLWGFRVYRHSWWRGSKTDPYRLAKATLAGEAATLLFLIAMYRFSGFSRLVFVLDAAFSWTLLMATRKSFSLFRNSLDTWSLGNGDTRRVFVLGTSERTELALRFLRDQRIACVGLIDTNGGADCGRWVWGTQVIGGLSDLSRLGPNHGVSEIVLPENESLPCSDMEFRAYCEQARLRLTKLGLYSAEAGSEGDNNDGRTKVLPSTAQSDTSIQPRPNARISSQR